MLLHSWNIRLSYIVIGHSKRSVKHKKSKGMPFIYLCDVLLVIDCFC